MKSSKNGWSPIEYIAVFALIGLFVILAMSLNKGAELKKVNLAKAEKFPPNMSLFCVFQYTNSETAEFRIWYNSESNGQQEVVLPGEIGCVCSSDTNSLVVDRGQVIEDAPTGQFFMTHSAISNESVATIHARKEYRTPKGWAKPPLIFSPTNTEHGKP